MVKTLPKILSVLCAMVLLFVVNTRPLCVSAADTPNLTLVESDYTASEVAQLIAGVDDAVLVVILIITGFIALTYITLRNVEAPIQFSSTDGFFDKCKSLGQYMLDHIDDNVKDIFYSIYEFVTAGNITSISSVPKLNLTTVGTFFAKIGAWLGGSLVSSVNTVSQGLLDMFSSSYLNFLTMSSVDFSSFDNYNSVPLSQCFGVVFLYSSKYYGRFLCANTNFSHSNYTCVITNNGVFVGTVSGDSFTTLGQSTYSPWLLSTDFTVSSPSTVRWLNNAYTTARNNVELNAYSIYANSNFSGGYYTGMSLYQFVLSLGFANYLYYDGTITSGSPSFALSDLTTLSGGAVTTTASDTVTVPLSDELVLQIADIAAAAAAGTIATTKDYYDELIAGLSLTITSALSGSNFTMPEGDYYIPSLDNIWKYVEYMFSTLGSWIIFAGKCIQCVTVGEGGLSWIFYGGFIFLICGGIVGKILLG